MVGIDSGVAPAQLDGVYAECLADGSLADGSTNVVYSASSYDVAVRVGVGIRQGQQSAVKYRYLGAARYAGDSVDWVGGVSGRQTP